MYYRRSFRRQTPKFRKLEGSGSGIFYGLSSLSLEVPA
jgi:hypothetical protein